MEASVTKNIAPDVKLGQGVSIYDFVICMGVQSATRRRLARSWRFRKVSPLEKIVKSKAIRLSVKA